MRSKEIRAMIKEGLFDPKATLPRKTVEKLTRRARPTVNLRRKTVKDQINANLKLVEFQTSVNDQLHPRGLHLRSRDFYNEFYVVPRDKVNDVIVSYHVKSGNANANAVTLQAGRRRTR